MALAKITTKGQVTIPKNISESLHLHTGDKIEIVINKQREAVISTVNLTETPESKQAYYQSRVFIYGEGETPKQLLWILPCADCYIMHEGKTIDTFSTRFK